MILATNVVLTLRTDVPNGLFMKGVRLSVSPFKKEKKKDSHQIYSVYGLPDLNIMLQQLTTL